MEEPSDHDVMYELESVERAKFEVFLGDWKQRYVYWENKNLQEPTFEEWKENAGLCFRDWKRL